MVGQILHKRFWSVVAAPDKNTTMHVILLQYDTDDELQEAIIDLQTQCGGLEVLSDYTRISLN